MQEYICRDGRMSVNGICAIDQKDSSETYDTTKTIIDVSKNNKTLNDLADKGSADYFPDLGKEKNEGKFEWDFDKPSKVESFTKTMSNSINAYNNFVEENLGISSATQNTLRAVTSLGAINSGGSLAAVLGPFALPAIIGNSIRGKLTDEDRQGKDKAPIDIMSFDIPTYNNNDNNNNNDSGPTAPGAGMGEGGGYASDYGFI
tara:strand:+ start:275 stop:883 length:609 start_codon:yes stop_codon:yes gene_type:complete